MGQHACSAQCLNSQESKTEACGDAPAQRDLPEDLPSDVPIKAESTDPPLDVDMPAEDKDVAQKQEDTAEAAASTEEPAASAEAAATTGEQAAPAEEPSAAPAAEEPTAAPAAEEISAAPAAESASPNAATSVEAPAATEQAEPKVEAAPADQPATAEETKTSEDATKKKKPAEAKKKKSPDAKKKVADTKKADHGKKVNKAPATAKEREEVWKAWSKDERVEKAGQLVEAASKGEVTKILDLVKAGVKVDAEDSEGRTALRAAAQEGQKECCEILIDNLQADINGKSKSKDTALHLAAKWKQYDIVVFLVKSGADRKIANNGGKTPAELCKNTDVQKWMQGTAPERAPPPPF
mmetsp:Transcript_52018/g.97599  ORF Transcript_52018/g.97599 Transcript_52018/m.97599 type:complete len:353 (-) Transcript_52018:67-1125(-)